MTPIERAARALCELDIRQKRKWDTAAEDLERIMPAAVDHAWEEYAEQARAVIAAIREPSERMIAAVDEAANGHGEYIFQTMIDALLEEGKP